MTAPDPTQLPKPYLPSLEQQLLLRAIEAPDDEFDTALAAWEARVDFETLDLGSIRLLPLLAQRFDGRSGADHPLLGRYRGIQRQSWAKNQQLLKAARQAGTILGEAGIRTIALKGIVLAAEFYDSPGLRPMSDIDLLVDQHELAAATAALDAAGWTFEDESLRGDHVAAAFQPAITMRSPATGSGQGQSHVQGVELDLHGRLFSKRFNADALADMWRDAQPLAGYDPLLRLGDTDMLLHICAHGARFNTVPPVRWIPDAMIVIARGNVDWDHLAVQAARWGLSYPLGICLDHLARHHGCDIPEAARRRHPASQMTRYQRRAYLIDQKPGHAYSLMDSLSEHDHVARHAGKALGPFTYVRYWRWRLSRLKGGYLLDRAGELISNTLAKRLGNRPGRRSDNGVARK